MNLVSERVRAAQAGDVVAMSELMDEVAPFVGRICGAVAAGDAHDAAQEALIQIFRDLHSLRERAALRAWIRRIATREAIRHAKRARDQAHLSYTDGDIDRAELRPAPDAAIEVRRTLACLRPEQRAILVLRDLEGFSEEEAAAELGVAVGTVKSRLHRAREAFRTRWSRDG